LKALTFQEGMEKEKNSDNASQLRTVSNSLRDLLAMWFGVGFLDLERVTWQSSCDMLQKVIYSVHFFTVALGAAYKPYSFQLYSIWCFTLPGF